MKIKACLTNKSDLWKTPKKLYRYFQELNFYDPCPENPKYNGLIINWKSLNFVNPPYSQISKWIDKAIIESEKNHESILLIPARTDTKWFRKLYEYGCYFTFIQGRLKFNDSNSAPFPSMLVCISKYIYKSKFDYINKENFESHYLSDGQHNTFTKG